MSRGSPAFRGTILEGRKQRYTVVNLRDVEKYVPLDIQEQFYEAFNAMCGHIETGRVEDGKKPFNCYLIINVDEPYANEVAEIMRRNGHLSPDEVQK